MKVRYTSHPDTTGEAEHFNTSCLGEVIVTYPEGDCSSEFISELQVQIGDDWKSLKEAFWKHDLITDNHNTCFFEPQNAAQRERGWA